MSKVTGKTKSGFEFSLDSRIFTDWNYLAILRKITGVNKDKPDPQIVGAIQDFIIYVLGEEKTNELVEHVRQNNEGFASIEDISAEVNEIFTILQETDQIKN